MVFSLSIVRSYLPACLQNVLMRATPLHGCTVDLLCCGQHSTLVSVTYSSDNHLLSNDDDTALSLQVHSVQINA